MKPNKIKHLHRLFLLCLFLPLSLLANSQIFPATGAARDLITWENGYFYIKGQPTFITSGEMHYARIPRELWRDRIWRSKQMGFNCMQMYVFWNASEPKEGQWDFTDNLDLDAWLSLVQEMGMYAVVRVGPYSCAEWENGGFPAWMSIKPGMILRNGDGPFLSYADKHLSEVERIVARHQINKGGNVLMVQLENEHPNGWGTEGNSYLKHLYDQARANGLEIPLFFSGLHHGGEPSGETPYPVGSSPWFTTEFWTGWIGKYGDMSPEMLAEKVRGTWKIIAFGGGGYDYYVVHGGSNFGYSGDSDMASYDYSAPIGEAGQFHNLYFPARRAANFARTMNDLLTSSHNDPSLAKSDVQGLRVIARTSPTEGSIVFIDSFQKTTRKGNLPEIAPKASAYQLPAGEKGGMIAMHLKLLDGSGLPHRGALLVSSFEPRTVLLNIPWTSNASFESICANVLFHKLIGSKAYWVCYGDPGTTGEVTLRRKTPSNAPAQFDFTYPTNATVQEISLDSGDNHQAALLVMNSNLAGHTWCGKDKLVVGAAFVREDGSVELPDLGGSATIYSATGKLEVKREAITPPDLPSLADWSWRDAAQECNPNNFNYAGWLSSPQPQPMETYDSFQNRIGWYRTTIHRDVAGPLPLHFANASGDLAVFFNGRPAELPNLPAKSGDNTLAILVKGSPRNKLFSYTGPSGTRTARGVWGGVSFDTAPTIPAISWKWVKAAPGTVKLTADEVTKSDYDDSLWTPVNLQENKTKLEIEKEQTDWFSGTFTVAAGKTKAYLRLPPVHSANGAIYLNGKLIGGLSDGSWSGVDVSSILVEGVNHLAMMVKSGLVDGTINLGVELWNEAPPSTWHFRGGLQDLDETAIVGRVTDWNEFMGKPWNTGSSAAGLPVFWKSTFNYHAKPGIWETIGLETKGLKSGYVWLNDHNLGECPQIYPMYMPECWLKEGANNLVIFDLKGAAPSQVKLMSYEGRQIVNACP